jgi:hypothetical protein
VRFDPHRQASDPVWDTRVPGFGVLVSDIEDADPARRGKAGRITFILYARFAPGAAPTRRPIGIYGAISLEEARRVAGEWRSQIDKGIDPTVVEAEAREKEARERALRVKHSVANVAETFITDKLARERRGKVAERDFRSHFVAAWGGRPVSEITKLDVLEIVNAKKHTAPDMARTLLVLVKRFFTGPSISKSTALIGHRATGSAHQKSLVRRSRAIDASTTPNCLHSGEPPDG